jgi:hypothetical protein
MELIWAALLISILVTLYALGIYKTLKEIK